MEQIKKNWIGWVMTILIAILTVIITQSVSDRSRDGYDLKVKLDSKLDKTEFKEHVNSNEVMFRQFNEKQDVQLTKMNEALQIILQQSAENRTDISWIKKELKR